MLIPDYWAQGRAQRRERGKQVTVRRFGWSQHSQDEAQAMADRRAAEALERIRGGEQLARQEPRVAYNGAEGVPIREEVLERHGETVITRNQYGAQCLNTPDVLFADVDLGPDADPAGFALAVALVGLIGIVAGWWAGGAMLALAGGLAAFVLGAGLSALLRRIRKARHGDVAQRALQRIRDFSAQHKDWLLRIYRTPAGYRVMALQRRFAPDEPAVTEFFERIGVDRLYARMCRNQRCFRARLTAKPWRIGIPGHVRPRPGIWPIHPDRLAERRAWIDAYERRATGYASCRYLESLGTAWADREAEAVQRLHDERCRAESDLPLA
jgi:hypothetical protein